MKSNFFTVILSVLFLASTFTTSFTQTNWTKFPNNPVLTQGPFGSWEDRGVYAPFVLKHGDTLKMWYSGAKSGDVHQIGYATSINGINWQRDPRNPVLNVGAPGSWDAEFVSHPKVILDDTTYHMWYGGTDDPSGYSYRIGYATSTDGINWTKHPDPVMDLGPPGSWDSATLGGHSYFFDGDTFHVWYGGCDGPNWSNALIGYAKSPDGITWEKHPDPVFYGSSGSWDDLRVYVPCVIVDNSGYKMWYQGYDGAYWRIGYATSLNGINWEALDSFVLDVGNPGRWDDVFVVHPHVLFDDTMWYAGGRANSGWRIGYAMDFSNIAHSYSISIISTYLQPDVDTLKINARIVNPDEHTLTATAQIVSENSTIVDSTNLSDNGDEIWSGKWPVPEGERTYRVGIKTIDEESGRIHNGLLWNIEKFTTIGPLVTDSVSAPRFSVFSPNRVAFDVYLENLGQTATAENVRARLYPDTTHSCFVSMGQSYRAFGDIEPGERAKGQFTMTIDTFCLKDSAIMIPFTVEISSGDYVFWIDSNDVTIDPTALGIEKFSTVIPVTFTLKQNYPNPFNPSTKIQYSLPKPEKVKIEVYNTLGQRVEILLDKHMKAGHHEIGFNAESLSSGIYFYQIEAGDFQDVKKMILIR